MPETFDLSREQLDEFEQRGVIRLPGFYRTADIDQMADRLWAFLDETWGMRRNDPESWTVAHPAQFQPLKRSGAFKAVATPKLFKLADILLGSGNWVAPAIWGGPLVTFPTPAPVLKRPGWHLDVSGIGLDPMPSLRTFTFLEPLRPHGGGTLYVPESHRLAIEIERTRGRPMRSKEVCGQLQEDYPWFAKLLTTPSEGLRPLLHREAQVGPYRVSLEEMTGAAGDVIVMHPAMLHGVAHNALDRPRLMLTEWIWRRGVGAD